MSNADNTSFILPRYLLFLHPKSNNRLEIFTVITGCDGYSPETLKRQNGGLLIPNDLEEIKKLRETVPFMKKDNIIAFKYENEKKSEIQMFKNLKENGLKDRSKILIEYE